MEQQVFKIIELGGTISSFCESPSSEFYQGPSTSIRTIINELDLEKHIDIEIEQFSSKISHEITIEELIKLANKIQSFVDSDGIAGIVVTMGTNALEDVAYFMGLVVKTKKPIVFTGAHYPQNSLAFDGKRNLFNALKIASDLQATELGVLVTFNDYVVTARDAVKNNPGLTHHFTAENIGIVGHVIGNKFILKFKPLYKHTYQSEFSTQQLTNLPKVSIIYAHIGMDDSLITASINSGVAGIISAGFGKGYQSSNITLSLNKAVKMGITVVRCSRVGCSYTSIDKNYDEKYGFIVANNLSPHKASLLLALGLSMNQDLNKIQEIFEEY